SSVVFAVASNIGSPPFLIFLQGKKRTQVAPSVPLCPVRIQNAAVAVRAQIGNCHMLRKNSRLTEYNLICFPQIQLIFSSGFFIKKISPDPFIKSFPETENHIFTDLIT